MAKRKPTYIVRRNAKARDGVEAKVTVTEAGRILIEAMAAEGNDPGTIAKALGIDRSTLNRIKERDEQVAEAWAMGLAQLADEITHALLALGRKGNVVALIFLAKCRLGWIDQPKPDERSPNIVINLPESRTPEDYMKLIEHQPMKQLPAPEKSDVFGPIPKAVVR